MSADRSGNVAAVSPRRLLAALALAQFISSYAGSNMNLVVLAGLAVVSLAAASLLPADLEPGGTPTKAIAPDAPDTVTQ